MTDRLSDLPDDLLRRILHFAPLKEAAATTALSRRWRGAPPLWLSSAALNLEIRGVQIYSEYEARLDLLSQRDSFFSEAVAALDAAQAPITRLTLRIEACSAEAVRDFVLNGEEDGVVDKNLVNVLLSHKAARRVEELRLFFRARGYYVGHAITVHALPLETLQVLELTDCQLVLNHTQTQTAAAPVLLPGLSSLRLRHCYQHLSSLQRFIDAAPALAALILDSVGIYATSPTLQPSASGTVRRLRLRCPSVTTLVMDSCRWQQKNRSGSGYQTIDGGVEINAPRLRRFRHMGKLLSFSFNPPQPLELEKLDLHDYKYSGDPGLDLATFWPLMSRSFTSIKEMRLRVDDHLENVAVLTEARRVELLPTFCRLRRMRLQGVRWNKGDNAAATAAVTIVNLLRCCPVLSVLGICLTAEHQAVDEHQQVVDASNKKGGVRSRIPQKIMHIPAETASRKNFTVRTTADRPVSIPALAPLRLLECVHNSLRVVGLHFCLLPEPNCLGLKLLDFFAENAMILEEMYTNGRDEKLCDHINRNTPRWNSRRRKSGATCFRVLPLK